MRNFHDRAPVSPSPPLYAYEPKTDFSIIKLTETLQSACIVSVITLWLRIDELDFYDRTWDVVTLWLMTVVEMNVGVIVACMPAVATVVRAHSPLLARLWTSIGSKFPSIEVKVSVRRPQRGSRGEGSEGYRGPSGASSRDVERGEKMVEVRAESVESGGSAGGRSYGGM